MEMFVIPSPRDNRYLIFMLFPDYLLQRIYLHTPFLQNWFHSVHICFGTTLT